MRSKPLCALALSCFALAGCENMSNMQQRALSGGAIGAVGGLAVTALTGGSLAAGALIGAGGGAAIGALTSPQAKGK